MDVRALRYFVEVVNQKGFTRASETLHVTQPTISKMVKQLEDEIGASLLLRGARGLQLTEAGRLVYARANGVLQQIGDLAAELDDLRQLVRGALRIGLPPMIGAAFFPPVLGEFRRRYPGVDLQIAEHGAKRIEAAVLDGTLDLGVAVLPVDEEPLETLPFIADRLALVAPVGSPWAQRDSVALADLAEAPFILFTEDFKLNDLIRAQCRACGFTPNEVGHSGQWDFIAAMVAADHGIGLLPLTICRRLDPAQTAIVPLTAPVIPWRLALIWLRGGPLSAAGRAWIAVTRELLAPAATPPRGADAAPAYAR